MQVLRAFVLFCAGATSTISNGGQRAKGARSKPKPSFMYVKLHGAYAYAVAVTWVQIVTLTSRPSWLLQLAL